MNNFLDNLAERATNSEQDVRPRLPSFFEPAIFVSEPARRQRGELTGVESFDVTLEQETSAAAPGKSFSQRPSREPGRDSQSGEQSDRAPAMGRMLSPAHQAFQPEAHSLSLSAQLSEEALDNGIEQASPKPAMASLRPRSSSSADRRDEMIEEIVIGRIGNKTFLSPALQSPFANDIGHREIDARREVVSLIAPRANPIAPLNVSQDEAQVVEGARNEASTTLVVRPKLDRYVEPPIPRAKTQSAQQPSEQVINVTIGRIEVRATPPPAKTSLSSDRKPPVMSLDDYLRQRGGTNRGGGG